jgi:dolichyl-phosphate-mannose-protein mannosyltransferase
MNAKTLALACTAFLGLCTTFSGYSYPERPLLDEHYYIADAQRTLHGVFYLKHNPPLGKLLIAAGEYLLQSNEHSDQFIELEVANVFGPGFSFQGYRLFPALLAWFTIPLFTAILLAMGLTPLRSVLFTMPLLFDTARIMHARAAMLDGPLTFFSVLTVFFIVLHWKRTRPSLALAAAAGAAFGCAVSVKFVAAPLVIAFIVVALRQRKHWKQSLLALTVAGAATLFTTFTIWQINFGLMHHTLPVLEEQGTFGVSQEFLAVIRSPQRWAPWKLPLLLSESAEYARVYNANIQEIDLCSNEELASLPWLWPLGHKSMRYLWTSGDQGTQYVTLAPNIVAWACSLLGILAALGLCISSGLSRVKLKRPGLLLMLLLVYIGFMAGFLETRRVLFLYHYFVPLTIGLMLFALATDEIRRWRPAVIDVALSLLMVCCVAAYQFYLPFVLFAPLTDAEFERRANLWPLFELQCGSCRRPSPFLTPRPTPADS